jgi:ABC-type uncharacterized transport system permease subunit
MIYDLSILLYIFSFIMLLIDFYFGKLLIKRAQVAFLIAAIVLNAALLSPRDMVSLHNLSMLSTLSVGVIYLIILFQSRKTYIGFFLLPSIICAALLSILWDNGRHGEVSSLWLYVHIPLVVVGMAFFLTAFASGIMYFILERQLKTKKFGRIFEKFPSLASIDKINSATLYLGFVFYTAGILAALGWIRFRFALSEEIGTSFYVKVAVASFAWVVTSVIVLVKLVRVTTARQTAFASVIGVASICLTYIAVSFFMLR